MIDSDQGVGRGRRGRRCGKCHQMSLVAAAPIPTPLTVPSPRGRWWTPGQAGQCRGRVHQQCAQPQLAARAAQLLGGVDGRVGVHGRARDPGLPRRWRRSRRSGRSPAHGAVRDPGPAAVAAGRSGPPGARADPGLDAAWGHHGSGGTRRRAWAARRGSSTGWRCCRPSRRRSIAPRTPPCSRRSATPDSSSPAPMWSVGCWTPQRHWLVRCWPRCCWRSPA